MHHHMHHHMHQQAHDAVNGDGISAAAYLLHFAGATGSEETASSPCTKQPDLGRFRLIFDSWGRVAARKLLILLVWGTDFSKV